MESSAFATLFVPLILVIILVILILSLLACFVYRVLFRQSASSKECPHFVPRPFLLRADILESRKADLEKGSEPCNDFDTSKISQPTSCSSTCDFSPNSATLRASQETIDVALVNTPQEPGRQSFEPSRKRDVASRENEEQRDSTNSVVIPNYAVNRNEETKSSASTKAVTQKQIVSDSDEPGLQPQAERHPTTVGCNSSVVTKGSVHSDESPKDGELSKNITTCSGGFSISPLRTDYEFSVSATSTVALETSPLDGLSVECGSAPDDLGNSSEILPNTESQSDSDLGGLESFDGCLSIGTDGSNICVGPSGLLSATISFFDWSESESSLTSPKEPTRVSPPTFPSHGVLWQHHRVTNSVEIAQTTLLRSRFALQRDYEVSVRIPNPINGHCASYRRATAPASYVPESEPRTPSSIRKEIRCKALRCSQTPYRPGLTSPLASAVAICGPGCPAVKGIRRASRERILFVDWSDFLVDQGSASELLIEVLRKSYERRRMEKAMASGLPLLPASNLDPLTDDLDIRSMLIADPKPFRPASEPNTSLPTTGTQTPTELINGDSVKLSAPHSSDDSGCKRIPPDPVPDLLPDHDVPAVASATRDSYSVAAAPPPASRPLPSPSHRKTDTCNLGQSESPSLPAESCVQSPSPAEGQKEPPSGCLRSLALREVSVHQQPKVSGRKHTGRRRSTIIGTRGAKVNSKATRKDAKPATLCSRRRGHNMLSTTVEGVPNAMSTKSPRRVSPPLVGGSPWIQRMPAGTNRVKLDASKPLTAPIRKSSLPQQENPQSIKRAAIESNSAVISHIKRRSLSDISASSLNARPGRLLDSSVLSSSAGFLETSSAQDSAVLSIPMPKLSANQPVTTDNKNHAPIRPSRAAIPPGSIILSSDTIL